MLHLRLRYLLDSKGIINPYNYLIRAGFTPNVATRLLNGKMGQIKLSQMSLLCKDLQCTPNDLMEYVSSAGDSLAGNHPLSTLVRNDKPFNIIGRINHLSLDQIREVEQFISKIEPAHDNDTD